MRTSPNDYRTMTYLKIDQTSTARARPVRKRSANGIGDFSSSKAIPAVVAIFEVIGRDIGGILSLEDKKREVDSRHVERRRRTAGL